MTDDRYWCQDCDEEVVTGGDFTRHANAGHAISQGQPS